jgi:hypothetical protein
MPRQGQTRPRIHKGVATADPDVTPGAPGMGGGRPLDMMITAARFDALSDALVTMIIRFKALLHAGVGTAADRSTRGSKSQLCGGKPV